MIKEEYNSRLKEYPALTNMPDFAIHRSMFIGCGGLGFESVNLFKKRVQRYFGDDLKPFNPLKFLSIDSANAQFQETESALDIENEVLRLKLEGWKNIAEQYPGVREDWFPKMDEMTADIREKILREFPAGAKGCGTTRIFGRLGTFSDNFDGNLAEHIRKFADRKVEAEYSINEMDGNAKVEDPEELYFYIITSIGGGTGTGVFMDTAAIIRSVQAELATGKIWHIYGVFVLPTLLTRAEPSGGIDKLNANSYAALKELMHFLDGKPFQARYGQSGERKVFVDGTTTGTTLFNVAFLLDGETQEGFALNGRLEVANFISGMLFKLSMTKAGDQHFQRHIDQAMSGIFNNRIPVSGGGRMVAPQRPSFAAFGWATAHTPLAEMIEYAQIKAAIKILIDIGTDSDPADPDDDLVSDYFFRPASGAENARFIDLTGLTKIIDNSYWNIQARCEHEEQIDENSRKTKLYKYDHFKSAAFKGQDTDAGSKEIKGQSMDEILGTLSTAMRKDFEPEKLINLADDFLNEYLGESLSEEKSFNPSESGKLGQAILQAQTKGQEFVLAGLEDLDEDLDELKKRANHQIDNLNKRLEKAKKDRQESFNDFQEQSDEFWTSFLWSIKIGKDVKNILEDFFDSDKKCKKLFFEKEVLKLLVKTIIPEYEKQVENWRNFISSVDERSKECIAVLQRKKKDFLTNIGTNAGCDFNIRFSDTVRKKFTKLFFEEIDLAAIKDNIKKNGVKIDMQPKSKKFIECLNDVTTLEITDLLIDIVKKATDQAIIRSDSSAASIFRLNFDDFTSNDKGNIFWNNDSGGDIQAVHSKLIRHGERMVKLSDFGGPEEKRYIFNSTIWELISGGANRLQGFYPHKITYTKLALGFAPYQLFYIHKWHKAYKKLIKKGEPLHIFEDAQTWDEPYTVYFYNINAEGIFELACNKDFGRFIRQDDDKNLYRITNKTIVNRFADRGCRFTIQDNRADIITELHSSRDIYEWLLKKTVIKIAQAADDDFKSKLASEGWLPEKMLDEIGPGGTGSTDTTGKGIKRPSRLFDLALEFKLIKKLPKDDEELYELKVKFLPKTQGCDWFVREEREIIIKELRLNEPLFELICKNIIRYVEFTVADRAARIELFKRLMPYLPPHFKGPLQEEYPAADA